MRKIWIVILATLPLLIWSQITQQTFVFSLPTGTNPTAPIVTLNVVVNQDKQRVYFNGTFTTQSNKNLKKLKNSKLGGSSQLDKQNSEPTIKVHMTFF
jgi:hypothetical protein